MYTHTQTHTDTHTRTLTHIHTHGYNIYIHVDGWAEGKTKGFIEPKRL